MRKIKLIVSIVFPLCVLFGLVLKTEIDIKQGKRLKLAIEGYDPRDLLRGHYINFRYQWDFDEEKTQKFIDINKDYHIKDVYICIPSNRKVYPVVELDDNENCEMRVFGKFKTNKSLPRYDFALGIEKYYVPEKFSKTLEDELRSKKGEVELVVNSQGRAVIIDFLIDGISWEKIISE